MTGGKTRRKRDGPGGSGCFHAFCYFLHPVGAGGFAWRSPGGADLVHDSPQNPVPPFPLHQVRVPFGRAAGADLVHELPQNPVPPFPLHQVRVPFRRAAGGDLVHEFPQNPVPSFPLHQVRAPFWRAVGVDLVHEFPQNPVPSFPLHQVRVPFRRPAGASPAFRHQVPSLISPRGKELTTNALSLPLRRQF